MIKLISFLLFIALMTLDQHLSAQFPVLSGRAPPWPAVDAPRVAMRDALELAAQAEELLAEQLLPAPAMLLIGPEVLPESLNLGASLIQPPIAPLAGGTSVADVPVQGMIEPANVSAASVGTTVCQSCGNGCADCGSCNTCQPSVASTWTPFDVFHGTRFSHLAKSTVDRFNIGLQFRRRRNRDRGLAYERVMFAPHVVDTAIGTPHFGIRYQLDSGLNTPDRAEFFWGDASPDGETNVNVQDLKFRMALGNDKALLRTQYTMRSLDPTVAANTTGFGDIELGGRALVLDGKRLKLATIFNSYLATGPVQRGLGTGHASIEPGLLARYCKSPETYYFGELKYWLPIGGTPNIAGDVLTTGVGVSTIAAESDVFAFMPTLELRTRSFLFGGESTNQRIDGKTAVELFPGARFALSPPSDLGLWEFGVASGFVMGDRDWFDTRIMFDLRWIR